MRRNNEGVRVYVRFIIARSALDSNNHGQYYYTEDLTQYNTYTAVREAVDSEVNDLESKFFQSGNGTYNIVSQPDLLHTRVMMDVAVDGLECESVLYREYEIQSLMQVTGIDGGKSHHYWYRGFLIIENIRTGKVKVRKDYRGRAIFKGHGLLSAVKYLDRISLKGN